jgi:hypothetical protein
MTVQRGGIFSGCSTGAQATAHVHGSNHFLAESRTRVRAAPAHTPPLPLPLPLRTLPRSTFAAVFADAAAEEAVIDTEIQ